MKRFGTKTSGDGRIFRTVTSSVPLLCGADSMKKEAKVCRSCNREMKALALSPPTGFVPCVASVGAEHRANEKQTISIFG